jgi:hypothetical protein
MTAESERITILQMIEDGTITPEEGLRLIKALEEHGSGDTAEEIAEVTTASYQENLPDLDASIDTKIASTTPEVIDSREGDHKTPPKIESEELQKWRRWWMIPMWVGIGITIFGGLLMYWAWASNGFGFWFACTWFPFLLGVAAMALAWGSRYSRWLHIRIQQKPGQKPERIAISFPIPLRFTAWILRNFGQYIPNIDATGLDEIILAVKDSTSSEAPLFIDVDEGKNGERVQIFIG